MVHGVWEKCARLLLLNSASDVIELVDTVERVIGNIVASPDNDKFKTIKISNKHIRSKILNKVGGMELMSAFRFVFETDADGNKILRLIDNDVLESGLKWLKNTSAACLEFASTSGSDNSRCCECEIQIRLPIGALVVSGGFMKEDSLQAVKDYAMCYFQASKASLVQIKIPPSGRCVSDDELQWSLDALGLCPRSVVLVTLLSNEESSQTLEKSHVIAEEQEIKKVFEATTERKRKLNQALEKKKNKESDIRLFQEDRHNTEFRTMLLPPTVGGVKKGEGSVLWRVGSLLLTVVAISAGFYVVALCVRNWSVLLKPPPPRDLF